MASSTFVRAPAAHLCRRTALSTAAVCVAAALSPLAGATLRAAPVATEAGMVSTTLALQARPQEKPDSARTDTIRPILLNPINVTATREAKTIFNTAAPVSVVDSQTVIEQRPNNAADLIQRLPGIDINGVGANQQRPTIRGQRGQRILLLENGLRLNNARRQADFGELPAIVDLNDVRRVEVVRGPASVLYGSDAIGGVVNMITSEAPPYAAGDQLGGRVDFSYRSAGDQLWPSGEVYGRSGRLGFRASGSYRNTDNYKAPEGTFGDITLNRDATVFGTGVTDQNYGLYLDYALSDDQKVFGQVDYYRADDAGFGYVSNQALGEEGAPSIDITYPNQDVVKLTAGYRATGLSLPVADKVEATTFYMDNERDFNFDIGIPFGAPGTGVFVNQSNYTDLETVGFRLEASKLLLGKHVLTYGADWYHDDSQNTDRSVQTVIPFPGADPSVEVDDTPTVPYATYDKLGVFAQADMQLHRRFALIVGGRWQDFRATPQPTPGLDQLPGKASENTFVAAANALFELLPSLNLVGTVGRGFRAPNLIELFFNGAVPEGNGFQIANPDLKPETSWNVDAGLKYRRSKVAFEGYYFRTWLRDGIRIAATGDSIGPFPSFQDVNVDRLTLQGVELLAEYEVLNGLTLGATYTWLDGNNEQDTNDENNPIADTYSSRITGEVTYRRPSGRWWTQAQVRHNGDQRNADFVIGSPIGDHLPAFTVMNLRGGMELFRTGRTRHEVVFGIENVTNELYAEFSNATFFRPAPRRTFLVSWVTRF